MLEIRTKLRAKPGDSRVEVKGRLDATGLVISEMPASTSDISTSWPLPVLRRRM